MLKWNNCSRGLGFYIVDFSRDIIEASDGLAVASITTDLADTFLRELCSWNYVHNKFPVKSIPMLPEKPRIIDRG